MKCVKFERQLPPQISLSIADVDQISHMSDGEAATSALSKIKPAKCSTIVEKKACQLKRVQTSFFPTQTETVNSQKEKRKKTRSLLDEGHLFVEKEKI
jgi:hypothetical protein